MRISSDAFPCFSDPDPGNSASLAEPAADPSAGMAPPPGKKERNRSLHAAKAAKEDEFYTQLRDVERELSHYRSHFPGKTVYLNCDDPRESAFFKYFHLNFERLGLRRLIATSYAGDRGGEAVLYDYEGDENGNGAPNPDEIRRPLTGDGDFRSDEAIALLKQADIVITNPPFSLFREYVAQLVEHDKKFLIIGNMNAVTYKDTFRLIRDGKMWLGNNNGDMKFMVPDHYSPRATRFWIDDNGQKWRSLGNACWVTNLDFKKRHELLDLYKTYDPKNGGDPADYPTYDNYPEIINVDKTADIPEDYDGVMGVPITFLNKWNPDQFEVLGIANSARWIGYECYTLLDGRKVYNRILIRRKARS